MQIKKVLNHGHTRWRVSTYVAGKRRQRFFSSKKLAVEWIKLLRVDAQTGNIEAVKQHLNAGTDVNANYHGNTVLCNVTINLTGFYEIF